MASHWHFLTYLRATERCRGEKYLLHIYHYRFFFSKTLIFIADILALIFQKGKEKVYLKWCYVRTCRCSCLLIRAEEMFSEKRITVCSTTAGSHNLSVIWSLSVFQLINFCSLLLQSCITKICILKQKGNSVHSEAQAGEKRSEQQPIHLLVLGVTALCFGALSEICWRVESGRVGVCNAIIARWAGGGSPEGLTDPKPGCIFSLFLAIRSAQR